MRISFQNFDIEETSRLEKRWSINKEEKKKKKKGREKLISVKNKA